MTKEGMKNCPYCDEEIQAIAIKCRYCKSMLINDDSSPSDLKPLEYKLIATDTKDEAQPKKQPTSEPPAKKKNNAAIIITVVCFLILAVVMMAVYDEPNNVGDLADGKNEIVQAEEIHTNIGDSQAEHADDTVYKVVVDVPEYENLNLRSGPGTNYSILGKLRRGTELIMLAEVTGVDGDQWLQVRTLEGKAGWVHKDYIRWLGPSQ